MLCGNECHSYSLERNKHYCSNEAKQQELYNEVVDSIIIQLIEDDLGKECKCFVQKDEKLSKLIDDCVECIYEVKRAEKRHKKEIDAIWEKQRKIEIQIEQRKREIWC